MSLYNSNKFKNNFSIKSPKANYLHQFTSHLFPSAPKNVIFPEKFFIIWKFVRHFKSQICTKKKLKCTTFDCWFYKEWKRKIYFLSCMFSLEKEEKTWFMLKRAVRCILYFPWSFGEAKTLWERNYFEFRGY